MYYCTTKYNFGEIISPKLTLKADVRKHVLAFKMYGFSIARGEPNYCTDNIGFVENIFIIFQRSLVLMIGIV